MTPRPPGHLLPDSDDPGLDGEPGVRLAGQRKERLGVWVVVPDVGVARRSPARTRSTRLSTGASGCSARNCAQPTAPIGMLTSSVPVREPTDARPVSWGHSDSVSRSYITRLSA